MIYFFHSELSKVEALRGGKFSCKSVKKISNIELVPGGNTALYLLYCLLCVPKIRQY